jgi:hypothetical protein
VTPGGTVRLMAPGYTPGMTLPAPASCAAARGATASSLAPTLSADLLREWDREHVWHAFTQMQEYEPLLIDRGVGAWLVDTEGRRYLDGSASMWCNVHGHRHPRLDAALEAQLGRVPTKDRSANGTSASVGRAARTMRSNSRDWPGWMRRSLRGAEGLPIHAQGRVFLVGSSPS